MTRYYTPVRDWIAKHPDITAITIIGYVALLVLQAAVNLVLGILF